MNTIQTLARILTRTHSPRKLSSLSQASRGLPDGRQFEDAEFELRTGDLWKTRNNFRELRIRCLDGILWITQTGDSNDIVLTPGEEFVARRRALVIVQSLTETRIRIQRAHKSG